MIHITRRERFCAAHRLFNENFTDKQNFEVFGKCSNSEWHGHNYELFVTVKGELNPQTGMLINIKQLSNIINQKVIDKLDHKNLNTQVDFLDGMIISTESLSVAIWKVLEPEISKLGIYLHSIKIKETENNFVEYFGE